jgi:hypothetical protein
MDGRRPKNLLVTLTRARGLRRPVAALAMALMVVAGASCDSTPTAPSTANVAGTWSGSTCPPNHIDACAIGFTISQAGTSLSGTYGTTSSHGTFTGTVTGPRVSMSMTASDPPTAVPFTWSLSATVNGDQMTGTADGRAISLSRISP